MTPQDFIAKWRAAELKERSAAQSHFNDHCRLLGPPEFSSSFVALAPLLPPSH
jgi:hypothetical protein